MQRPDPPLPEPLPAPLVSERRTGLIGGALVSLGPVSMVLYTPATPTLVDDFATTQALVQLTLSVYFAGFALTQLVIGPLSDAFGRRPVALAFLGFYVMATAAAMLAPTIEWMLGARLLQGMAAAVGVVIARAIVRDQYVGQTSARIMNVMVMLLAVTPAFAPLVGGVVLELASWRAIFVLMLLYGLAVAALVRFALPETNRHRELARLRPGRLLASYAALLTDARFLRPSLVNGLTVGCVYVVATLLPFVLIDRVGLAPGQYGLAMMAQGGSFLLGTMAVARLLARVDAVRLVVPGLTIMGAAGLAMAALLGLLEPTVATVMAPLALLSFGMAFALPALNTAAVASFPTIAGSASALLGFMQIGSGFVFSLAGAALSDPALAAATVIPAMPLLAAAVYFALRERPLRAGAPPG